MQMRTVTAEPAVQPASSRPRASAPERPKLTAEATAKASPVELLEGRITDLS